MYSYSITLNIAGMTYQFFKTLFKFCFPEKDPEKLDEVELAVTSDPETSSVGFGVGSEPRSGSSTLESTSATSTASLPTTLSSTDKPKDKEKGKRSRVKRKESKFYVAMTEKDDVEKMKERAERNMLFICVKVPEVPVRVSYKGEKEKNIEDVQDVHVLIPTLEYNNITWTWLDFLVAVRNHSKRVLLSQVYKNQIIMTLIKRVSGFKVSGCMQAIKQKLWRKNIISSDSAGPQEEDKAKMLLGLPVR